MHRGACRFVDGEQVLILEQHWKLAGWCEAGRGARLKRLLPFVGGLRCAHRRNPDLVTGRNPSIGTGPALVDTHLAAADDAVDVRLGHTLETAHQEIVQPLATVLVINLQVAHMSAASPGFAKSRQGVRGNLGAARRFLMRHLCRHFGPYNVFH